MRRLISCEQADRERPGLVPLSSLTNYVGGEVLNPELPPHTVTIWGDTDGNEALEEKLDESGCAHWRIEARP